VQDENIFNMSDKKEQGSAGGKKWSQSETSEAGDAEERPLWEYLERVERRTKVPMFCELAATLSGNRSGLESRDFVN
jgi:hypothetical protein